MIRRIWNRVLWGPTGPPVRTPRPVPEHPDPTPRPLPDLHPDRFTSLTPEERETWGEMEPWLKGL